MNQSQESKRNRGGRAAVFLDRDGTIIEDRGHLADPSQVAFFPETIEALAALQKHFQLFIVTNQSGVGKGLIELEAVRRVNEHVVSALRDRGIEITDTYVCPHRREDNCECIKPRPHFLEKAAAEHGIDLRRSFSIGDHPCDAELAGRVGGQGLYILTGHGEKHRHEVPPGTVVLANLKAAADWILAAAAPEQANKIGRAAKILREGGLVALPTETVYGLGANALDARAVARIFEAKRRPHFDPLIVHITSLDQLTELAAEFPDKARRLTERFWPGPLTVVLPKTDAVPDLVTSGLPTVAVRMPAHPAALELIRRANRPIAAPSANLFGSVSPTRAEHVREQLGDQVDCILDGGPCAVGVESTIISFTGPTPVVLRPGGIGVEAIESVIGPVEIAGRSDKRPLSPGRLERHYATRTPLRLCDEVACPPTGKRTGLLTPGPATRDGFAAVEVLSESGSLPEAAANLFAAMRRLDAAGLDLIIAVAAVNEGIGRAINDRLYRASQK